MYSVFHNPAYHHMVNSNPLKLYELSAQIPNRQLAVPRPGKTDLMRPPSTRQSGNRSLMLEESMLLSNWNTRSTNRTMTILMRNKTLFKRVELCTSPRKRSREKVAQLDSQSGTSLSNGSTNQVLKRSPKHTSFIKNSCAEKQRQLLTANTNTPTSAFFDDLINQLASIDQQLYYIFLNTMQSGANILLNTAPVPQLTSAFNFLSAIFKYFAIQIGNAICNEIIPRLRYYVMDPVIEKVSIHMLKFHELMETENTRNGAVFNELESKRDAFAFITSTPCQSCLQRCPGQYPSLEDALPPKAIQSLRSRERFLMDCPKRHLQLLGVVSETTTTNKDRNFMYN